MPAKTRRGRGPAAAPAAADAWLPIAARILAGALVVAAGVAWAGAGDALLVPLATVAAIVLVLRPPRVPPRQDPDAPTSAVVNELRRRVVNETRMSAALLDVATTLTSTLETPELLVQLNLTARNELRAEWAATFLVDSDARTFRLVARSEADRDGHFSGKVELPMDSWTPGARLAREQVVVLGGTEAARACALFGDGRSASVVLVTALHREGALAGFLAIGCGTLATDEHERAVRFLAALARHATVVLRNAKLIEEVRLASALKSEFVGAISHELRSPLNVILGYVEMFLDEALGPVTSDQVQALRRTHEQSLALLEMITALLDLNRLESGRLPLQRAEVSVECVIGEICEQIPPSWRRPDVALLRAVVPGIGTIQTDAGKLKTVVRNLIHNAFKFTERGHVTVGAAITDTGEIAISVSDTGRGIPRDALNYVFEMFRQVPGAGGGGVGLGLHLVRRLVAALGGSVSVQSELGAGTCFTVVVPRVLPDGDEPAGRAGGDRLRPARGRIAPTASVRGVAAPATGADVARATSA